MIAFLALASSAQGVITRHLREAPRQLSQSEHIALFQESDSNTSLVTEAIIRVTNVDVLQSENYSDVLVRSGDPAFTDSIGIDYEFGGRLDGAFFPQDKAGNTFRGVTANGNHITFYAALVPALNVNDPFSPISSKIGLFRADISGPTPTIEAVAVHGELVSNFLFFTDSILTGAVWEIPPFETVSTGQSGRNSVPNRSQPLRGWVAPSSMNSNGLMAFRAAIKKPNDAVRGAIFQHFEFTNQLAMLAIENESTRQISTGLPGVGDVTPTLLGPPIINDNYNVSFYAGEGSGLAGVFFTDNGFNGLHALMHGNQDFNEISATDITNVPRSIQPRSAGIELDLINGFWFDQPSINCNGDVAFRATAQFPQDNFNSNCIVRWTNDTDDFEVLFRQYEPLPPRLDSSAVLPDADIFNYPPSIGKASCSLASTFSRPVINGHGEVAVIAQIADTALADPCGKSNKGNEALLLYNRDGDAITLARTMSDQWMFTEQVTPFDTYRIRAFGSFNGTAFNPSSGSYYKGIHLNDYGQVLIAMNTVSENGQAEHAGTGYANVEQGFQFDEYRRDLGALVLSGGSPQDGDSGLERINTSGVHDALWLVDPADLENLGPDPDLVLGYPDHLVVCNADFNHDGVIDTAELGQLIDEFTMQPPYEMDLNGDGVVDTADLGMLISVFGDFCDGCGLFGGGSAPESLIAGPGTLPPTPLLRELGFFCVDEYCQWLETLSEDQVIDHISDCIAIIQAAE